MAERPDRNLALELVRVTEAAALAAGRFMGRADKEAGDRAAVDAMRLVLNTVEMDGVVVIGEGEKDEAPMLYNGEVLGTGREPKIDIAVDPIDGTRLLALGKANSLATVASGLVLDASGFVPNVEQSETSLFGMRLLIGGLPCVGFLLGAALFRRFPLGQRPKASAVAAAGAA